ncbi:hypothetical protein [Bartonella harrusi]|uniref:Uncharacterized protein n=1 Tax=Bartonella harrusi TaxID=2961895 RepID=A0ABY5ESU8_9HYPH|nr:hypothetical protein [Bartonella harrusi]UTO28170.1 hypothetical protein NMK50_08350 [Bartonella harrusi]
MGIVLAGIGGVCIVGTVLVLAYQRAAECGGIALLMVLEMGAFCCIVGGILGLIYQGGCIEGRVDKEAECVVGAHGVLF